VYQRALTDRRHTSQVLAADLDRGLGRERITQVSDSVAILLTVWSYALGLGSRERGGRTRLRKGWRSAQATNKSCVACMR
jgi:hypothetical protein